MTQQTTNPADAIRTLEARPMSATEWADLAVDATSDQLAEAIRVDAERDAAVRCRFCGIALDPDRGAYDIYTGRDDEGRPLYACQNSAPCLERVDSVRDAAPVAIAEPATMDDVVEFVVARGWKVNAQYRNNDGFVVNAEGPGGSWVRITTADESRPATMSAFVVEVTSRNVHGPAAIAAAIVELS